MMHCVCLEAYFALIQKQQKSAVCSNMFLSHVAKMHFDVFSLNTSQQDTARPRYNQKCSILKEIK